MKDTSAAQISATGFGFDEIIRNADHTRFPRWYAQFNRLAPGHRAAAKAHPSERPRT